MKQLTSRQTNATALAIAAVAAWRMPNGYGLTENDSLFAGSAITLILLAGLKPAEQARLPGVLLALIAASMLVARSG